MDYNTWIQQLIQSLLQGNMPGFSATTSGNPAGYPGMIGQLPSGTPAVGSSGFFPGGTGFNPNTQVPSTAFNAPFPGMPLPPLPPGQASSPIQQAQGPLGQQGAPAGGMSPGQFYANLSSGNPGAYYNTLAAGAGYSPAQIAQGWGQIQPGVQGNR